MHVYCVLLFYLCGKEMEERGQGGPSGLVPIWHGVDPTARNSFLKSINVTEYPG
jgi:hypothetical protein